jgi:hypothetical protein
MLKHLCCDTPERRIRLGWISLQSNGDVSVGLSDKSYIAPRFKGRHFLWNAYNRVRIRYIVPSDGESLEGVRNPHFTFHTPNWFHLKPSRPRHAEALFEAIADVPLTLMQDARMPWIRATTSPLRQLAGGDRRPSDIAVEDLIARSSTENISIRIEVDLIRPENCRPANDGWEWSFARENVGVRVSLAITHPQIATLGWFHQY